MQKEGGSECYHPGLEKGIVSKLNSILPNCLQTLILQFNIDGPPIFKISKLQFNKASQQLTQNHPTSPPARPHGLHN